MDSLKTPALKLLLHSSISISSRALDSFLAAFFPEVPTGLPIVFSSSVLPKTTFLKLN
jgi:hypothetical protein